MIQLDIFQTIFNGFNDIFEKKTFHEICQKGLKKGLRMSAMAPISLCLPKTKIIMFRNYQYNHIF